MNLKIHTVLNSNDYIEYFTQFDVLSNSFASMENLLKISNLTLFLKNIVNNCEILKLISSQSFNHYNGFFKIILFRGKSKIFRIHIWDSINYTLNYKENIHNHRWDFMSILLSGECIHELYRYSEFGEVYYEYEYNPKNKKSDTNLRFLGINKLEKIKSEIIVSPNKYLIDSDDLHRVTTKKYTASFVVTSSLKKQVTNVFNEDKINLNSTYSKKVLDYLMLKKLFEKLILQIEKAHNKN